MPLVASKPSVSVNPNPGQYLRNILVMNQNRHENNAERRKQEFAEGADARELAKADAERERKRQVEIDKASTVTKILSNDSNQFAFQPSSVEAMQQMEEYQAILPGGPETTRPDGTGLFTDADKEGLAKQGELMSGFISYMRANPNLHMNPDQISSQIRAAARAEGRSPAEVEAMVAQGLESFKILDPATAALKNTNINKDAENQTKILAAALKGSGTNANGVSGSSIFSGVNKRPGQGDANLRSNLDAYKETLSDMGASKEASLMTKALDWINPVNDTDVTRQNASPIFGFLAENEIGFPAALQVLESRGHLSDGEWKNGFFSGGKSGEELLNDPVEMQKIVDAGKRIQDGNSGIAGSNILMNGATLSAASANLQNNTDARRTQLFSQLAPRQQTLGERNQLARDYITEQTGVAPTFKLPTPNDRKETKKNRINTDSTDKNSPAATSSEPLLNKDVDTGSTTTSIFGPDQQRADNSISPLRTKEAILDERNELLKKLRSGNGDTNTRQRLEELNKEAREAGKQSGTEILSDIGNFVGDTVKSVGNFARVTQRDSQAKLAKITALRAQLQKAETPGEIARLRGELVQARKAAPASPKKVSAATKILQNTVPKDDTLGQKRRLNVISDFSGTGTNRQRFEQGLSPQQVRAYRKAQDPNTSEIEAIRIMKQLRKSSP